ncbi:hypothetical protein E3P99_02779 [Wallemia hederae]|uniref:Ketoreductase (KR) domain-containing protein n=1 Tax=Wallemia hederae TaxID=1540922 RepID=A0A4T0FKF4_9BASI|nr:hypothetical protein E3P99_02779 [Wallemia hederae]
MLFNSPEVKVNGQSFKDKTVICIGANAGIGYAMSEYLLQNGVSRLVMGCRSLEKGEKARSAVLKAAQDKGLSPSVELWQIDLSSLDSCRAFTRKWNQQGDADRHLDIVYLNAGLVAPNSSQTTSADGLELTYAANVIGHLVLVEGLLPSLSMANDPRIIFTGSYGSKLTWVPEPPASNPRTPLRDNWEVCGYSLNAFLIYCDTKLLLNMVVRELQHALDTHPVQAYRKIWTGVFHPGTVNTTISNKEHYGVSSLITKPVNLLMRYTAKTPLEGALPGLFLGSEDVQNLPKGAYWHDNAQVDTVSRQYENVELRRLYFKRCLSDAQINPAVFQVDGA